ncbi:MAG TPA: hypothetical protein VM715_19895 [Candidatus Acidoferrum sp.]|jgi:hypothetical protein|nr:hypothetical protein [Candidatus Acidoferrum sp.]
MAGKQRAGKTGASAMPKGMRAGTATGRGNKAVATGGNANGAPSAFSRGAAKVGHKVVAGKKANPVTNNKTGNAGAGHTGAASKQGKAGARANPVRQGRGNR